VFLIVLESSELISFAKGLIRSLEIESTFLGHAGKAATHFCLRFPGWVATQIILFPARAKCLFFFLQVARCLYDLQSFNAFCLVMNGLESIAVQRLKSVAWEPVFEGGHEQLWADLQKAHALVKRLSYPTQGRSPISPPLVAFQLQSLLR
jgi:hypothetical protein